MRKLPAQHPCAITKIERWLIEDHEASDGRVYSVAHNDSGDIIVHSKLKPRAEATGEDLWKLGNGERLDDWNDVEDLHKRGDELYPLELVAMITMAAKEAEAKAEAEADRRYRAQKRAQAQVSDQEHSKGKGPQIVQ